MGGVGVHNMVSLSSAGRLQHAGLREVQSRDGASRVGAVGKLEMLTEAGFSYLWATPYTSCFVF